MITSTIVELNQDIGCHILTFLDGIDATNFIEAVNNSEQFRCRVSYLKVSQMSVKLMMNNLS